LKLNGTRQLLVYAADVNIVGWGVHTTKEHAEAWIVNSNKERLEVNADKTKYTFMSPDKNMSQSQY
jgi:hypothetical protein